MIFSLWLVQFLALGCNIVGGVFVLVPFLAVADFRFLKIGSLFQNLNDGYFEIIRFGCFNVDIIFTRYISIFLCLFSLNFVSCCKIRTKDTQKQSKDIFKFKFQMLIQFYEMLSTSLNFQICFK